MPQNIYVQKGDRIAMIDGDTVHLGTIAAVHYAEAEIYISWDDGLEDDTPWTWPSEWLKTVR